MNSIVILLVVLYMIAAVQHEKILLRDVTTLLLRSGEYTTSRRTSPVPQLECVSGRKDYTSAAVLCHNSGFDGSDVIWKCQDDDLPYDMKFEFAEVQCEGYDYPDDPYILKGSCGLRYSLKHQGRHQSSGYYHGSTTPGSNSGAGYLVLLAFVVLCVFLCMCSGGNVARNPDAPPPYMNDGYNNHSGWGSGWGWGRPRRTTGMQGGGFWTGMGLGGALGYGAAAARNNNRRTGGWGSGMSSHTRTAPSSSRSGGTTHARTSRR